jgi:hypothetical protein
MIVINPVISQILSSKNVKYFYLVTLEGLGAFTSLPYNVTMSDNITYTSDGGLLYIDPPSLSSVVDRSMYKVSFVDPDFTLKNFLDQGAVGKNVSVRIAFFNTLDSTVDSVEVGQPFLNLQYTILLYRGIIDTYSYDINLEENTSRVELEISSPMADLDLIKPYHTNKDFSSQLNPNDTAYNEIYDGAQSVKLKWGKS